METTADIQSFAVLLTRRQGTLRDLATFGQDPSSRTCGTLLVEVPLARLRFLQPVLQTPNECLFLWDGI